eukprot:3684764-Prymnesium_polylepis.1
MGPGPGAGGPWVVCVDNSCCDTDSKLRLPHLYTPPVAPSPARRFVGACTPPWYTQKILR